MILTRVIFRHNAIEYIVDTHDTHVHDKNDISQAFISFYTDLFTAGSTDQSIFMHSLIEPAVSSSENKILCSIPDYTEVKAALFSMGSHKSPGLDGFTPLFFKNY